MHILSLTIGSNVDAFTGCESFKAGPMQVCQEAAHHMLDLNDCVPGILA